MKRLTLLLLLFCFTVSGCSFYGKDEYSEQDLIVHGVRNATYYEYQHKVAVSIRYSSSKDSLDLRTGGDDESWLGTSFTYKSVLTGDFEKVGWYNDNLFILIDEVYYSLDIDEYEIPQLDENGNREPPDYELKEYNESEFTSSYPNYKSFDWYGH